jgi:hypothetical protein
MEGKKFDFEKASWDLVPSQYLVSMSVAIKPFIEMYMLKDKKIVFDKNHIYNVVRSNIVRWHLKGRDSYLGNAHPLMNSMIGILMISCPKEYSYEDVFTDNEFRQRWDLINPVWTTKIAEVYSYGARKYEKNNWMKVESHRYYSALNRHLDAFWAGENYDSESGFLHLYHAAWNCIAIQWLEDRDRTNEIKSVIPPEIIRAAKKMKTIELSAMPAKIVKK